MWTRSSLLAGALMCVFASGCSSCEPDRPAPAPKPAPKPSAAPVPSEQPLTFERRHLTRRDSPIVPAKLVADRSELLETLAKARSALDAGEPAAPLIDKLVEQAPMSPVIRLLSSSAALAAGDTAGAIRAARVAVYGAEGRDPLLTDALLALGNALLAAKQPAAARVAFERALESSPKSKSAKKALAAEVGAADGGATTDDSPRTLTAPEDKAVCDVLVADVKGDHSPVSSAKPSELKRVTCTPDAELVLGSGKITRALAFRVDTEGPLRERFVYVGTEGESGIQMIGPVASSMGQDAEGVVNDTLVDLQRIDVLRGGSPEVVVKISDRRTAPDPALDEVLELDRTHAMLLTVDRGKLEESREFVLEESAVRRELGAGGKKLPKGYSPLRGLGKVASFRMKVSWSGPNSITLERTTGKAKPPVDGSITLFPTPSE